MLGKIVSPLYKKNWRTAGGIALFSILVFPALLFWKTNKPLRLTPEEKAWLKEHPVIRLAPDPDFPPTEFLDSNGNHTGISADYTALLQKKLGIKFEIVKLRDWAEVLKKTRQREVDVLAAVTRTPERSGYLLFTQPYLELPAVIITRDNFTGPLNLQNLTGKKVSIKAGYGARYYVVTNYPQIHVDVVPDIHTGLRKVSFGMRDALLENLLTASYYMEKEVITNLRIAGEAEYVYKMSFAVRNDWPQLQRILDKGLALISADERKAIYNKWVPINSQVLLVNKRIKPALLIGAGMLTISVVLFFLWNRSLSKQVAKRTRELSAELIERGRIESALRESEEKFRVLAETSSVAIFLYQGENLVYVNPSATILMGISEEECLSMKFWEWANSDAQSLVKTYGLARQQGDPVPEQYEATFRTRDGKIKWVLICGGRIVYRGKPGGLASVFDITERKHMENELLRINEELEQRVRERTAELAASMETLRFTQFAVEKSSDQAFWLREDFRFFYVNDSACFSLEYTRRELLGMSLSDIDPLRCFKSPAEFWRTLRDKGSVTFESMHHAKSGRSFPVEVRANYVEFDGKEYCCCFVSDISERKKAEKSLRQSESNLRTVAAALQEKQGLLRTLIDSIPDLIFYKDTEGRYLGCNKAFEEFVGKPEEEVIGRTDFELVPHNVALFFRDMEGRALPRKSARRNEAWGEYPDGRRVLLETLKTPYHNAEGKLIGLVGISRDITSRKQSEEALRKAHDELESRVRERTEQLTSLTAELSRAEELERKRIATDLHDQVAQTLALSKMKLNSLLSMQKGGEREIIREIQDYLSTSIDEIRSLTFQLSPPLLHEVGLAAALEWLGEQFQEKYGLRVRFQDDEKPKPLEEEIGGALYQMSRELMMNIVKHARAKNVLIESGTVSGKVVIRISDDGTGFDSSNILNCTNTNGSFGLLNIHHRTKYLGGELSIESGRSGGTRVSLTMPFRETAS